MEKNTNFHLDCVKNIFKNFIMEMVGNMKEFLKWLGVNEKIAKVAVWILIFMVSLIIINACLESVGFPNYELTVDNLAKINVHKVIECLFSWAIILLNFYSIVLLVFRISKFKDIFKYSIIYLISNIIVCDLTNYAITQIFIFLYIMVFCYLFSNKSWKYVLYGLVSILINTGIQYVCYTYKMKLIDFDTLRETARIVLSLDYFIITGVIILVKEIYLKKRSENV